MNGNTRGNIAEYFRETGKRMKFLLVMEEGDMCLTRLSGFAKLDERGMQYCRVWARGWKWFRLHCSWDSCIIAIESLSDIKDCFRVGYTWCYASVAVLLPGERGPPRQYLAISSNDEEVDHKMAMD